MPGTLAVDTVVVGQDRAIPMIHRAGLEGAAADVHSRLGAMRGTARAVGAVGGEVSSRARLAEESDMADIVEQVSRRREGLVDSRGPTWFDVAWDQTPKTEEG